MKVLYEADPRFLSFNAYKASLIQVILNLIKLNLVILMWNINLILYFQT